MPYRDNNIRRGKAAAAATENVIFNLKIMRMFLFQPPLMIAFYHNVLKISLSGWDFQFNSCNHSTFNCYYCPI